MIDGDKRCSCGAGHSTFGACLRDRNIQLVNVAGNHKNRNHDERLKFYASARRQGLHPEGTHPNQVAAAIKAADAQ